MGGAQTAVANDFYALHFNPAGLSRLQKGSAGFSRHKWILDRFPITFTGGVYATRYGTLGLALHHFDLEQTSLGETLDSYHRAFQFSYARQVGAHVALGGTLKLVQLKSDRPQDTPDVKTSAWGFDVGLLVQNVFAHLTYSRASPGFPEKLRRYDRSSGFQGLSLGLALLNTGPGRFHIVASDPSIESPLPQLLRLGLAFNAVDTDEVGVLLALDLDNLLVEPDENLRPKGFVENWFEAWDDGFDNFRFGAEIELYHIFAVRFGRDEFLNPVPDADISEWTFGVGLGPEWARLNLVRRSFPISERNKKWVVDFAIAY